MKIITYLGLLHSGNRKLLNLGERIGRCYEDSQFRRPLSKTRRPVGGLRDDNGGTGTSGAHEFSVVVLVMRADFHGPSCVSVRQPELILFLCTFNSQRRRFKFQLPAAVPTYDAAVRLAIRLHYTAKTLTIAQKTRKRT